MCYSKTAPIAKSKASHMISNDFDQYGTEMFGAVISSFFSFSKGLRHPLSKVKCMSLVKRLVKDLAILLKSVINLR